MKYTFKDKPKLRKVYGSPSLQPDEDLNMLIEDYNKLDEWLKGLENNLRQSLAYAIKQRKRGIARGFWFGYERAIEEVLGEGYEE